MSEETPKEETRSDEAEATPDHAATEAAADDSEPEAESAEAPTPDSSEAEGEAVAEGAVAEEAEPAPPAEPEAVPAKEEAPAAPQHTFEELHAMNVAQLRDIAAGIEHDAVHGYTTMHKEHLVPAICNALGIEAHVHHEVVGIDKGKVKARIRELKKERDAAEAAGDKTQLRLTRRRIRGLKRRIRKATV